MGNNFKISIGQGILIVILLLMVAVTGGYLVGRWQQIGFYQQDLEKVADLNACH